jgi:hypothetical protein
LYLSRKQPAIYIGKALRPSRKQGALALALLGIHCPKGFADHLMGVRRIPRSHFVYGIGKQALASENVGIFSKKTEDQPGHEVIHFMAQLAGSPT